MTEKQVSFHAASSKRKILVVEDELINREILSFMLQDAYDVLLAETGSQAKALLNDHYKTLSLVLLDLNLPDMKGIDILRSIKEEGPTALLPVIVMTADQNAEVECLSLGAVDFIPKPYPKQEIVLARIRRTIELYEDRDIIRWTERDQLTNVVFMGQGEPMDNLDNVLKTTEILTAADGYAWSPKRITVSSVGVKNKLKRFLDESQCHVAISMHSPLHEQRLSLMPAEKAMNISEVVELLKQYDFTHQRRCSFEYICFSGLNDTLEHGREIVRLVKGLECRVNLIRFHQIPNVDLPGADLSRMEQLRDYLTTNGVFTTIRASRGQDIFAACGLLSTEKKKNQKQ